MQLYMLEYAKSLEHYKQEQLLSALAQTPLMTSQCHYKLLTCSLKHGKETREVKICVIYSK